VGAFCTRTNHARARRPPGATRLALFASASDHLDHLTIHTASLTEEFVC
jgi:hypothetical protein